MLTKHFSRRRALGTLAAVVATAAPSVSIGATRTLGRTEALISDLMARGLCVGAQLYASLGGVPTASLATGLAAPGVAMTPDKVAIWYSNTKVVTAIAIAILWEEGRLDIEDFVADHIPEFAQGGKERIRIRHVLSHSAGFPRAGRALWLQGLSPELIAAICEAPIEEGWVPGEERVYHPASGAYIAAEIVQRLSGKSFQAFVRTRLFEPLRMADCHIGLSRETMASLGDRMVLMYQGQPLAPGGRGMVSAVNPGFGGVGPMTSLARLYETLLARGRGPSGPFLRPQTVDAMTAAHVCDVPVRDVGGRVETPPQGLGFAVNQRYFGRHRSPRSFGHAGGAESVAMCDPEKSLVLAFMLNGRMPGTDEASDRLTDVATAVYEDLGLV